MTPTPYTMKAAPKPFVSIAITPLTSALILSPTEFRQTKPCYFYQNANSRPIKPINSFHTLIIIALIIARNVPVLNEIALYKSLDQSCPKHFNDSPYPVFYHLYLQPLILSIIELSRFTDWKFLLHDVCNKVDFLRSLVLYYRPYRSSRSGKYLFRGEKPRVCSSPREYRKCGRVHSVNWIRSNQSHLQNTEDRLVLVFSI